MKISTLFVAFTLICFALSPKAQAVVPPPDGGYPGYNTAEGENALLQLTTGTYNTAVGWSSLASLMTGHYNTGIGAAALVYNTRSENTAIGAAALSNNTTGGNNTATGAFALNANTIGLYNTATGANALNANTTGVNNTAIGNGALVFNRTGAANTAVGEGALANNKSDFNTAIGVEALVSITTGHDNTALGMHAGYTLETGSGNVCIGSGVLGVAGESNTTRIRNIYSSVVSGRAVYVSSGNKIGTLASTRRVKENIKPMEKASDAVLALKPVSFRYKKEIDASGTPQFGLVAEEVADINPDLVTRDSKGKPETVRYEAVNAMLLNEFLKEHKTVQQQGQTIARLEKQLETVTATLQKVSAQLEVNKATPKTVLNNR